MNCERLHEALAYEGRTMILLPETLQMSLPKEARAFQPIPNDTAICIWQPTDHQHSRNGAGLLPTLPRAHSGINFSPFLFVVSSKRQGTPAFNDYA